MEIIVAIILVITNRWLDVLDRRGLFITVAVMAVMPAWGAIQGQQWIIIQSSAVLCMAVSRIIRMRPRSTTL